MFRLFHRTAGKLAALIAITAVALNVLWPLITHIKPEMAAMQMAGCDDPGMMMYSGIDGTNSSSDEPSPLMPHCAFCTLVSGGFAALVVHNSTAVLSIRSEESWSAFPEDGPLVALLGYSPAHPRAPPVLS